LKVLPIECRDMANIQFLQWLIGFLEGDGNFQTIKKERKNKSGTITHIGVGYAIHIGLGLLELALLEHIKEVLGMGNINSYPNKGKNGVAHYAITKKEDLVILLQKLSNYPFLISYQRMRLELVQQGLRQSITRFDTAKDYNNWKKSVMATVTDFSYLDPNYVKNWLVGLINAEGHFLTNQSGFLLEHTDQAILEFIVEFLGLSQTVKPIKQREGRKETFVLSIYH